MSFLFLVLSFLVALLIWLIYRQRLFPSRTLGSLSIPDSAIPDEVDVVVIGAGPGGLAATRELLAHPSIHSVLLLEQGTGGLDSPLSFGAIPSFMLELGSGQSSGLGGTSRLSRGVFYPPDALAPFDSQRQSDEVQSLFTAEEIDDKSKVRVHLPIFPSVLLWGTLEALRTLAISDETHKTSLSIHFEGSDLSFVPASFDSKKDSVGVWTRPTWSFVDPLEGTRPPLASQFLFPLPSCSEIRQVWTKGKLTVVTGAIVQPLQTTTSSARVSEVTYQLVTDATQRLHTVRLRKGCICAAGVIQSPKLLPMLPSLPVQDVIAVPLIFETRRGISSDVPNARRLTYQLVHLFRVFLGCRFGRLFKPSPLHRIVSGSLLWIVPFKSSCPVLIEVLAAAGFASPPQLFASQQWNSVLCVFSEAFAFRMVLLCDMTELPKHSKALVETVRFLRHLISEHSLANLLTGREALDLTLLTSRDKLRESSRALFGSSKRQGQNSREIRQNLLSKATSEDYLKAYCLKHAVPAGFACGSLAFPSDTSELASIENVFVGDASVCSFTSQNCPTVGYRGGRGGTVTTAAIAGRQAAQQLFHQQVNS